MRFLMLLLCLVLLPAPAPAGDLQLLKDAVRAADQNQYSRAVALAKRAGYPFMADALRGEAYAKDALGGGYEDIAEFLAAYPVFPERRTLISTAEGYMTQTSPPNGLDKFYGDTKPITLNGFAAYINYLLANGRQSDAADLIRDRWVNGPLATGDDTAFRQTYRDFLGTRDDVARLDRLIWEEESVAAQRVYGYIDPAYRALAEARFALQRGDIDAGNKMQRVPQQLQDDAGLVYAHVRYRRERDDTGGALDLLSRITGAPTGPSGDYGAGAVAQQAWWKERHILIRRLIEQQNYRAAYAIAAAHGLEPKGKTAGDFATAEFMAGWLALRFLNDAPRAAQHFGALQQNVTQPVSKSRGAYWLGRAYEAAGDREGARQWYTEATNYPFFFYGQLAMQKLGNNTLTIEDEQPMPPEVRARFTRQPLVQIIHAYTDIREEGRAKKFLRALLPSLGTRAEFAYAAELGRKIGPEMEVEAAKAANSKGFTLSGYGYPTVRLGDRHSPEAALTLGLIRQESQFQSDVESPAGAKGLMQLLPSSAKGIAKKYDEPYRGPNSLYDPNLNITLGRHYLGDRIEQFDGSYIKAIAAYNAGQGRVRQWEDEIGDPKAGADPIDWIELIPIYETRNYVQRVLEGTQVYRALLNRGSAPLRLTSDLQR